MTEDRWELQPGGLYLSVSPFDRTNTQHRDAAAEVMHRTVQTVAQFHGAGFSENGFCRNMHALYSGNIRVDFFLAKWDVCSAKPIYLGAALKWPTVGIDQNGNVRRGVYIEDLCLLTNRLRQLVQAKPDGKEFPKEGLLECFERISLQNMKANGEVFKYGEVDLNNIRAVQPQIKNGGMFGNVGNSAVLEFEKIPSLFDRDLIDLPVIYQPKNDFEDEPIFIVPWQDEKSDVRFIVTQGQATTAARRRVDIRPWHNGALPDQETLETVVASALFAIKNEVESESWARQSMNVMPSPSIPVAGSKTEKRKALYDSCGTELIFPASSRPSTFGTLAPSAHAFIINDRPMLDAFNAVGAAPRLFGNRPMMPGVNVTSRTSDLIA